ncbi:MAG: ABC transporter ATP-binding protein [Lachnospiraceae bacterium]|nr:ABC transporter ATP-binding protein [Lachnospiraceae bacterium]
MPILRSHQLKKDFQVGETVTKVLKGVDLTIEEGEFVVILGPSGSGKSTMLNIIGGIETITSGELYYRDEPIHEMKTKDLIEYRRKHIGFVFQFYNLLPNLSALENVQVAAELSDHPLDAGEMLERVGLADRKEHYPSGMSGGQQQRVAIARALCKNPELLLCDEPTGALDIKTGEEVLTLLTEYNKEHGTTIIMVTHNVLIAQIADRVIHFRDGVIGEVEHNEHPLHPGEVKW